MKYRTTVIALIQNDKKEYLICKKPQNAGVFPGQWAIPGGGIDENEKMKDALRREVMEEVGLEISDIKPFYFTDDVQPKYKDGEKVDDVYMIYLLFTCRAVSAEVTLDHEHEEYAWVKLKNMWDYDLNLATKETFKRLEKNG